MKKLPSLEELDQISQNHGKGAKRKMLESWGVSWPPPNGWLKALKREVLEGAGDKIIKQSDPRRPNGKKDREARQLERAKKIAKHMPRRGYAPKSNDKTSPKSFYASWEWRTLRMEVLKTFGHRCQSCGASAGDITIGGTPVKIVVDHIKPLSQFWHLRLDRSNLQVLCDECNMGKGAWDHTDYRPTGTVIWGDKWPDDTTLN